MKLLRRPKDARELLALWDNLVTAASRRADDEAEADAVRFQKQRDLFHDAAFGERFALGALDELTRDPQYKHYKEAWWQSAQRLFISCLIGHEYYPTHAGDAYRNACDAARLAYHRAWGIIEDA